MNDIKSIRMKYRQKSIRCECSDPGCPVCHGQCNRLATTVLFNSQMEDRTGTRMCQRCSQDAMESGLFRERPVRVRLREDLQTGAHRLIPRIIESMDMNDPDDWNALADALEDSGYTDKAILARLRRMDATAFQYLHLG